MYLRPIPYVSKEERMATRPQPGDLVVYEGKKYKVEKMGMKYLHVSDPDNPKAVFLVKVTEVVKYVESKHNDEDNGPNFEQEIAFDFLK